MAFTYIQYIYTDKGLLIGGRPISPSYWSGTNIRLLNDIYNDMGLRSFQDIRGAFNLPGYLFFFYLQLRSALKAQCPMATTFAYLSNV